MVRSGLIQTESYGLVHKRSKMQSTTKYLRNIMWYIDNEICTIISVRRHYWQGQWHIQDSFNGSVLKFNRLMVSGELCPLHRITLINTMYLYKLLHQ
jgi:hypothetical protein